MQKYYDGYDKLHSLDVPGIHKPMKEGAIIYQEFEGQLKQKANGRYKTEFI